MSLTDFDAAREAIDADYSGAPKFAHANILSGQARHRRGGIGTGLLVTAVAGSGPTDTFSAITPAGIPGLIAAQLLGALAAKTFALDGTRGENLRRLALVTNDVGLIRSLRPRFEQEGFRVDAFTEHEPGLRAVRERRFDIVIIDLERAGSGAIAIASELRERGRSPLPVPIFLTSDEDVCVEAVRSGADGCTAKPENGRELLTRVQAMLRTIDARNPTLTRYDDGVLSVNLRAQTATVHGKPVSLSASEAALLALLIQVAPMSLRAEEISAELAGTDESLRPSTIDSQVKSLRKKIGPYIEGRPGYGYSFLSRTGR